MDQALEALDLQLMLYARQGRQLREFMPMKKFIPWATDLKAMANENSASAMQAVLLCLSENFRRLNPVNRILAVEALIKKGWPVDLVGLCQKFNVRPIVFLTCRPDASGPPGLEASANSADLSGGPMRPVGLRLDLDYDLLDPESPWIMLLSDGNGLVWLPVARRISNGPAAINVTYEYIVGPTAGLEYFDRLETGPCAEYAMGSSVIYNGSLYTVIKRVGHVYIIEDANDSSKQKEVKSADLGASTVARSDMDLENRIEETKRRLNHTVANYDIIDVSIHGFFDYVKDAGRLALQVETQH